MIGRFFACLLGVLLLCGMVARAQFIPLGFKGPTAAAGYSGPGDIVSGAWGYWGLDAYNLAWADGAHKSLQLTRNSDNATQDILILNTGLFDVASATTFCASTVCKVTIVYDQSGNGRNMTAAQATSPTLIFSGCSPGVAACLDWNYASGNGQPTTSATFSAGAQPYLLLAIGWENLTTGQTVALLQVTGAPICQIAMAAVDLLQGSCATGVTQAMANSAWTAAAVYPNGTSGYMNVNGTTYSSQNMGSSTTSNVARFGIGIGPRAVRWAAAGLWVATISTGNVDSIVSNARDSAHFNF